MHASSLFHITLSNKTDQHMHIEGNMHAVTNKNMIASTNHVSIKNHQEPQWHRSHKAELRGSIN